MTRLAFTVPTRMITGEGTIFSEESEVVGRFGGWSAPESISRDKSTGFESVEAYFDSDNEDSGGNSVLHLESPSLRNITLPRPPPPPPPLPQALQVSTPFPGRIRDSRPDVFREPPPPPPQMRIASPPPASPSSPEVQRRVANEVAKPAARMQDDGYYGEYDASVFEGPDNDYEPVDSPEEEDILVIDQIEAFSPQALPPREPLEPLQPLELPSPEAPEIQEPRDPRDAHEYQEPLDSEPQSEPGVRGAPAPTLRFKRVRPERDPDEGPRSPLRYDVPLDDLDPPEYAEVFEVKGPELEEYPSDEEGSVISMIIENDTENHTLLYKEQRDSLDSSSDDESDTEPSSHSDSEVEEIEIPLQLPPSPDREGPRRSKRTKIPRLDTWRGEYVVYDYDPDTGTRAATFAHTVEPDVGPVDQVKKPPRRRQPITVLEPSTGSTETGRAPLFDESIRDYQQQILAKSLNPADSDGSRQVPFPEAPSVLINTILEGQRGMPVVIAQLTFGRGAAIPPRNSGELWYTFICWTGRVQFTVHDKAVVLQREGAVTIPAGNDFFIENLGVGSARILMVQATCQDIAEEYSRMDASRISNFDDIASGPSSAGRAVVANAGPGRD